MQNGQKFGAVVSEKHVHEGHFGVTQNFTENQ